MQCSILACYAPQHSCNGLERNLKPVPRPAAAADTVLRDDEHAGVTKKPSSGSLVIFAAPGACVTRVSISEISQFVLIPPMVVVMFLRDG